MNCTGDDELGTIDEIASVAAVDCLRDTLASPSVDLVLVTSVVVMFITTVFTVDAEMELEVAVCVGSAVDGPKVKLEESVAMVTKVEGARGSDGGIAVKGHRKIDIMVL